MVVLGIAMGLTGDLDKDGNKKFVLKDKSYLHLNLNRSIADQAQKSDFKMTGLFNNDQIGLSEILKSINDAQQDSLIEGIYLECGFVGTGHASIEEIRNALLSFKESGKWIVSYSEIYSQKGYYLASVADELYLFPKGIVEWKGLGRRMSFYKGFFDKTGIEMQVIRGSNNKFKSAVEPFLTDKISDANREQTETYQNALWAKMMKGVSDARGINLNELDGYAETLSVSSPEIAVEAKMFDQLLYEDEVIAILRAKMNIEEDDKLPALSFAKYNRREVKADIKDLDKAKIAVLFAQGEITSGKSENNESIASESIMQSIRKLQKNEDIKAVVLRINSPGGSALASEAIWRELEILNEKKPVVVSMGNVAASGGYYIACGADHIIAQPNTITGSIGVFGTIPYIGKFMTDKLGITYSDVQTNSHATMGSLSKRLSDTEYLLIQQEVDRIYNVFKSRVAKGRNISEEEVDAIGQGRVWSGVDALSIGLVDELGGIKDAIAKAVELAEVEEYKVVEFPKLKDPFQQFVNELTGNTEEKVAQWLMGDNAELKELLRIKHMTSQKGVWARLPYEETY